MSKSPMNLLKYFMNKAPTVGVVTWIFILNMDLNIEEELSEFFFQPVTGEIEHEMANT